MEICDSEGKNILRYGIVYEKSRKNRDAAVRVHGTRCMACGFDFGEKYGELSKDFIEVYHIKPLSSVEEMKVDLRTNMVCLCSNCHRTIHRTEGTILTYEELREIVSGDSGFKN